MVPLLNIIGMLFSLSVTFVFPVVFIAYLKRRHNSSLITFVVGLFVYLLSALVVENFAFRLLFIIFKDLKTAYNENGWIYVIVGAVMAGIFEELGRFIAMKHLVKDSGELQSHFMYSLGHVGLEVIVLATIPMGYNLLMSLFLNFGLGDKMIAAKLSAEEYELLFTTLTSNRAGVYFMSGIGRICTLAFQAAATITTYIAVNQKGKSWFLFVSMLIHTLACFGMLAAATFIKSDAVANIVLLMLAAITGIIGYFLYKKMCKKTI